MLGWRAAGLPCRLAPHLGIISMAQADDQSIIAAGRAFQRVWLTATGLGLSLQPLPASALYALEGARREGIPETLQCHLQQQWVSILPYQHPIMIFRMGRTSSPKITTLRKPLIYYVDFKDTRKGGQPPFTMKSQ